VRRPDRLLRLQMVTAAHFMHERELRQNRAPRVRPPR
jgi:hypothetical protein